MVGKRLKDLRRAKNVRQEDLATILGVQKAVISHYETDKVDPSDKVKVEIAKFFDISMDYLMGIIDEAVPCYHSEIFMKIPKNIRKDERDLLEEFIGFINHKRKT